MKHTAVRAISLPGVLIALLLSAAPTGRADVIKRSNPPTPEPGGTNYLGWIERSHHGGSLTQLVASAWINFNEGDVNHFTWWGGYEGWNGTTPPPAAPTAFRLHLWSHDSGGSVQPLTVLWTATVAAVDVSYETSISDPRAEPKTTNSIFRFDVDLLPGAAFPPGPPELQIYWLSIGAVDTNAAPLHPWGWLLRQHPTDQAGPDRGVLIEDPNAPNIGDSLVIASAAGNGEPWDAAFVLSVYETPTNDFGDAPSSYGTTLQEDGARHGVGSSLFLGTAPDVEPDGIPSAGANSDDSTGSDDEDGVSLGAALIPGATHSITVTASVAGGRLNAWIDFDRDGNWMSPNDSIAASIPLSAGANVVSFAVPGSAASGTTMARFRLSTQPGLGINGPAPDGEVEDHAIAIGGLDFGDAPQEFPTQQSFDGARHTTPSALWLGSAPDTESDGQPSAGADGDDLAGTDDEDGVAVASEISSSNTNYLFATASASGRFSAWIDFNGNLAWDSASERVATNVAVTAGVNTIRFVAPAGITSAIVIARARIATAVLAGPTGAAADGEVEDFAIPVASFDFGDAPAGLPTLRASNGARHTIPSALWLGNAPDAESDGQPSAEADGDDLSGTDDEDGVAFAGPLLPGQPASLSLTVSASGLASVWIDFNGNLAWNATTERIATNLEVTAGLNTIPFTVPVGAVSGEIAARVRVATAPIAGPTGVAADGEVEDLLAPRTYDFGDAPDGVGNAQGLPMAAYPSVSATFPTVEGTTAITGPRHRFPSALVWLGATVTTEEHAEFGSDSDPTNNLVPPTDMADQDGGDDGVVMPLQLPHCEETSLRYVLTAASTPTNPLYLNVWFDWNRDGDWGDTPGCVGVSTAPEWPVQNQVITIPGPGVYTNTTPAFTSWHPLPEVTTALWMRITISEVALNPNDMDRPGHGPTNGYQYGETEDYLITDYGQADYDYGDARDTFPVRASQSGARHAINPAIRLGATIDAESDGQPTIDCTGDDAAGTDDEDGVVFPPTLTGGSVANVQVVASVSGFVGGWLDANGNGNWTDSGEHIWQAVAVVAGNNTVALQLPQTLASGAHAFRVRFSTATAGIGTPDGTASDGEVEDYNVEAIGNDWGDAPAPFPVLNADNGASHLGNTALRLGAEWDSESDGQQSAGATGDDGNGTPDDEDGVSLPAGGLRAGATNAIRVVSSGTGILSAWMDLDQNGSWADAGEHIIANVNLAVGANDLAVVIPASASGSTLAARFRLSSQTGLSYTGPAPDGEVEDYVFGLETMDLGDAPASFPVLLAEDGARHFGPSPIFLGSAWDTETNGQASTGADGDDVNGAPDDEDGVIADSELYAGTTSIIQVIASAPGVLNAWFDWNGSGDWAGAGEHVVSNRSLAAGTNALAILLPPTAAPGQMAARFRISSASNLTVLGSAPDGEVEDHALLVVGMDLGDAPAAFPVTLAQDGARHAGPPTLLMGLAWDGESDGAASADASGDDAAGSPDDEDGVTLPAGLAPGIPTVVRVTVNASGVLNAWLDLNQNDSWADAGEQVVTNASVAAGANDLPVMIPLSATGDSLTARFRLSSQPGLSYTGPAPDGEVEDYVFSLQTMDFGDAADPYPVALDQDGARHFGPSPIFLGAAWDAETNGQASTGADGDDVNGEPDDEDGVIADSELYAGTTSIIQVIASAPGVLNAWFDWNGSGDWAGTGEHVVSNRSLAAGTNALAILLPPTAAPGQMTARFRISSASNLTVLGSAPDGEVEDHVFAMKGLDYGDAPAAYPVTLAQNGARHAGPPALRFGTAWDGEADGQPSADAKEDDRGGSVDDEDGVVLPAGLTLGTPSAVRVTVNAPGVLNAWMDLDQNGSWAEPGEQVISNIGLGAGANVLLLTIPVTFTGDTLVARFRLSSQPGLSFTGPSPDGEVEDFSFAMQALDFGDAPPSFPVTLAQNGARHTGPFALYLGTAWDGETNGLPGAASAGDDVDGDIDDEDGVTLPAGLLSGRTNLIRVTASAPGILSAWMDLNRNGAWTGAAERVFSNVAVVAGANDLPVFIPASVAPGALESRFRVSSASNLATTGQAPDGEVEDHQLLVQATDFGDAPSTYPVTLAQDGAGHAGPSPLFLGAAWDGDANGQPGAAATGDDNNGAPDDEDGVTMPAGSLAADATNILRVVASAPGLLNAWMDLDDDGTWEGAGEQVFTNVALTAGANDLPLFLAQLPAGTRVVSRFRFSSQADVATTGTAPDGEVEDHALDVVGFDYGDAPASYPVTLADDGASHRGPSSLFLGAAWDGEPNGQPGTAATGDDLNGSPDDEDGVTMPAGGLIAGRYNEVTIVASAQGLLTAWFDLDRDGTWTQEGECLLSDVNVAAGPNVLQVGIPGTVGPGAVMARFRLSSATNLAVTGEAPDGEVEDHKLVVLGFDFGDALDTYPVTLEQDGARHTGPSPLFLGAAWDGETNGQPGAAATGDDLAGSPDDEDGVTLPDGLTAGMTSVVRVVASTTGVVNAWMDLDGNGSWAEAGEQVISNATVQAGTNNLIAILPASATSDTLVARFRVSTSSDLSFTGAAADGEVEDYLFALQSLDYGDAPATFPVQTAQDGARHRIKPGVYLGAQADAEADGQPSAGADGDDLAGMNDEDGVVFADPLSPGQNTRLLVTATTGGYLSVWFDWNRDGDWGDSQETIQIAQSIAAGTNTLSIAVPTNAVPGAAAARFRFSTGALGVSAPTGYADDGEVEDYAPVVGLIDFGDAPTGYAVRISEDGARHRMGSGLLLGAQVDGESDGQPSAGADGDDLNGGPDDEDGVTVPAGMSQGGTAVVQVVSSGAGYLSAWMDFNGDLSWTGLNEQVIADAAVTSGLNLLSFPMPAVVTQAAVIARFRLSTQAGLTYAGLAPDGEVEDHRLALNAPLFDFGDAPTNYPVTLAQNGAQHAAGSALTLGSGKDVESDGQPGEQADGDDLNGGTDDEDGIQLPPSFGRGESAQLGITVSTNGLLNAWIDFNGDGDWLDAGEQIASDMALGPGSNPLSVLTPTVAVPGASFARFRFSSVAGLAPTGLASDGEVEDYPVTISSPAGLYRGDYGDAPDPSNQLAIAMSAYGPGIAASYPTVFSDGTFPTGPWHRNPRGLCWLGAAVSAEDAADQGTDDDGENNLQPTSDTANRDGADDGLQLPVSFPSFGTATVACVLTRTAAGPATAYLNVWVDWNRDGDWADEIAQGSALVPEWAVKNHPVLLTGSGTFTNISPSFLTFHPQPGVTTALWLRVSVADQAAPDPAPLEPRYGGAGPGIGYAFGETEDYRLTSYGEPGLDFGDAPTNFPVAEAHGGARHLLQPGVRLGAAADAEPDGQPSANAEGDDVAGVDDEDGVVFTGLLLAGFDATVQVSATASGYLGAWFDWNGDGDWDDPGENSLAGVPLSAGDSPLAVSVPADAARGSVAARFRFAWSAEGVASPTGLAASGEVEDYLPAVHGVDFGDAEVTYPTTLAANGARHAGPLGPRLGALWDAELDGHPTADADGDDVTDLDDEDGVSLPAALRPGANADFRVESTGGGWLNVWIDFGRDGSWADESDHVLTNVAVTAGVNLMSIGVPSSLTAGTVVARFRLSSQPGLSFTGMAPDGEVEDYLLGVGEPIAADFGDAPNPYPTRLSDDGARHLVISELRLGSVIDVEVDGQPSTGALGDDVNGSPDDEDGVAFPATWLVGSAKNLTITASAAGALNAWMDFNRDGDWSDAGEQIALDVSLAAGPNTLSVSVPPTALVGPTVARFRFSTATGLAPHGAAADGEVEDYGVVITQSGATLEPPAMTGILRTGTTTVLQVITQGSAFYQLQATTNLLRNEAGWQPKGLIKPTPINAFTNADPPVPLEAFRVVAPYVE